MGAYKYKLPAPLRHLTLHAGPPFRNAWLWIHPVGGMLWEIEVSPGYAWDGCTLAPDLRGTKWASCLHDAPYQYAETIAQATGWSVARVLRWADRVFLERMLDDGAGPIVAWVYYAAVCTAGYAYHVLARAFRGPAELRCKRKRHDHADARQG